MSFARRRPILTALLVIVAASTTTSGAAALGANSVVSVPEVNWVWPAGQEREVLRPFMAPATVYASGHRGIDIVAEQVYSPADGVVHFAGRVVDRSVLSISHSDGLISSFEPVTTHLRAGQPVRRGDAIATVVPGHCPQLCLHFGVRLEGAYLSPERLYGTLPRSVLLPPLSAG
ncbi:MAG TPA: M23 family metallopeptidase [Glaciihabitans sp.]|jgi:murein DD-endopeptidase MepM/ murein hydrolase activator NlpD|nr:M23 family metallopeptidase [Glaciihabitans sp.]